jgi:hypothetical protein
VQFGKKTKSYPNLEPNITSDKTTHEKKNVIKEDDENSSPRSRHGPHPSEAKQRMESRNWTNFILALRVAFHLSARLPEYRAGMKGNPLATIRLGAPKNIMNHKDLV